jgi:hypothetical protein
MTFRPATLLVALGALTLGACTYVERERPPQQSTVVVPQQQPQPMVVQPSAPPTVTVRPSY